MTKIAVVPFRFVTSLQNKRILIIAFCQYRPRLGSLNIFRHLCVHILIGIIKMKTKSVFVFQAFAVALCTAKKNSLFTSTGNEVLLNPSTSRSTKTASLLSSSSSSQQHHVLHNALMGLRGGAGPLPPEIVAKTATALVGLNSATNIFAPDITIKTTGLPSSPFLNFKLDAVGFICTFHSLIAACILFGKTSIQTAIGVGFLFLSIFHIKTIMAGTPQKYGFPALGQYISIAMNVITAHGLFTDAPYASSLTKIVSAFMVLNGMVLSTNRIHNPIWGYHEDSPSPDLNAFFDKFLGYSMIAAATFCVLLISEMDAMKALGYACIPSLFNVIQQNFITKEVQTYGLKKGQQIFSLLILTIIVGTLAF